MPLYMQCTCSVHAVNMQCTCSVPAVNMQCTCSVGVQEDRRYNIYSFLTSVLDGLECGLRSGRFTPEKSASSTNGRLDEPQGRSGRFGEEKNLLLPPGIEPRFLDFSAHNLVTVLTTFSLKSCQTVFVLVVSTVT